MPPRSPLMPRAREVACRLLVVTAAASLWIACGGPVRGPAATLDAYSNAVSKHDYAAAYDLMSSSFRERHSKADFVRMMQDNAEEAQDTAALLRDPKKDLVVTAEFQYGLGDHMRLVQEDGTWRIANNPIQFYSQGTPRDALRSFIRAYRLGRWDIMLRFVPNDFRATMDADKLRRQFEGESRDEVDAIMQRLETAVDEPIHDNGSEARMTYGDGNEVKFIREDGVWKIQDID